MIYLIIIMSILSSCAYRAGGMSQEQPYWIPKLLRHSWVRDWLCPLFCLLPLYLQHPSWIFAPIYLIMAAAFSTYYKFIYKHRANFWIAGFVLGIVAMPLVYCGFVWWHLLLRAVFIAVTWGALSDIFVNDHLEEHSRGFFVAVSALLS